MEETIYQLYASKCENNTNDDTSQVKKQSLKSTKINLLKKPNFNPPQTGIVASEFYFLNSKKNLVSTFTQPVKEHATFGLPKKAYQITKNDENKIIPTLHNMRNRSAQRSSEIEKSDKTHYRPPIPKFSETPIQGLQSNLNFINVNRERAQSMRPKTFKRELDYLKKHNYGKAPNYLEVVKEIVGKEKEYIQMVSEIKNPTKTNRLELNQDEINKLKEGLIEKYKTVNKEYQSITHVSKIYSHGVKRKKEFCEKELMQIEKDLKVLEKGKILIEL